MQALAIMCKRLGVKADTIKFHRDDPKTSKTCPGTKVKKAYVVNSVQQIIDGTNANENAEDYTAWTIVVDGKPNWTLTRVSHGSVIVRSVDFAKYLVPTSSVKMIPGSKLEWDAEGKTVTLNIVEMDENNRSWASVRQMAESIGYKVDVNNTVITLRK